MQVAGLKQSWVTQCKNTASSRQFYLLTREEAGNSVSELLRFQPRIKACLKQKVPVYVHRLISFHMLNEKDVDSDVRLTLGLDSSPVPC